METAATARANRARLRRRRAAKPERFPPRFVPTPDFDVAFNGQR